MHGRLDVKSLRIHWMPVKSYKFSDAILKASAAQNPQIERQSGRFRAGGSEHQQWPLCHRGAGGGGINGVKTECPPERKLIVIDKRNKNNKKDCGGSLPIAHVYPDHV